MHSRAAKGDRIKHNYGQVIFLQWTNLCFKMELHIESLQNYLGW